jgi:hypothetical protein
MSASGASIAATAGSSNSSKYGSSAESVGRVQWIGTMLSRAPQGF